MSDNCKQNKKQHIVTHSCWNIDICCREIWCKNINAILKNDSDSVSIKSITWGFYLNVMCFFLDYSNATVYITSCAIWFSSLSTELLLPSSLLYIYNVSTSTLNVLDGHIVKSVVNNNMEQ